jgi:hypothetical protein
MTRASEWVEEMFTEWVCKIEDERQLESWGRLIESRRYALKSARQLSLDAIRDGLRSCERGTKLYADKSIGDSGDTECFFMQYQPRAKRVWTASTSDASPGLWRHMTLREAHHVQLARTDLTTRMRAPKPMLPEKGKRT